MVKNQRLLAIVPMRDRRRGLRQTPAEIAQVVFSSGASIRVEQPQSHECGAMLIESEYNTPVPAKPTLIRPVDRFNLKKLQIPTNPSEPYKCCSRPVPVPRENRLRDPFA